MAAILLSLLWCQPLMASRVENIFSAEVGVEDSSEEVRLEGTRAALASVMVRLTGSREAALRPELLELSDTAAAFVQSYRYRRDRDGLFLSVTFDGAALQSRIAQAGIPVWGAERPDVLVWLAVDYGGGRRSVVPADSDEAAAQAIRAAARERGLPVSLPLMDAQDRERVSFADIWGGFTESVEAASSRYAPDAILVGRARTLSGGGMRVDWKLQFGAEVISERGGLGDGIEIAADYFAGQFAVGGGLGGQYVTLEVTELSDLATYARVLRHLKNLSVVDQARLIRVAGDSAFLELSLRGTEEQLRRALALGGVLRERAPDPLQDPSVLPTGMRYRPVP